MVDEPSSQVINKYNIPEKSRARINENVITPYKIHSIAEAEEHMNLEELVKALSNRSKAIVCNPTIHRMAQGVLSQKREPYAKK